MRGFEYKRVPLHKLFVFKELWSLSLKSRLQASSALTVSPGLEMERLPPRRRGVSRKLGESGKQYELRAKQKWGSCRIYSWKSTRGFSQRAGNSTSHQVRTESLYELRLRVSIKSHDFVTYLSRLFVGSKFKCPSWTCDWTCTNQCTHHSDPLPECQVHVLCLDQFD